jgi:hypothetical protein
LRTPGSALNQKSFTPAQVHSISHLVIVNIGFFSIYGAIIGSLNGPLQALAAAIKLPLLFMLTTAVCTTVLHVTLLVLGSKHSLAQLIRALLTSLAATATVLVAFAPITLFFLLTSDNRPFFLLFNTVVIGGSALFGLRYLLRYMDSINEEGDAERRGQRRNLMRGWIVLFAFVGCQLGWSMRPFFGSPHMPFQVFRKQEGNVYVSIAKNMREMID